MRTTVEGSSRRSGHTRIRLSAGGLLALVLTAGCAASSAGVGAGPAAAPTTAGPAAATIFATATPPNAPTQQMTLYHVDVPVGAVIAPHQHPGQQISHVTAGTLTYTLKSGAVTLFDPPVDGKPGPSRRVNAPTTIEISAGQSLTEPEGEVHTATNKGSEVVRIDIAVLVPIGDPISVPAG